MRKDQELDDWIQEIIETRDQLSRLANQLRALKKEDFQGMIGRIEHLQIRLDEIQKFIGRLNTKYE
jgi:hypothetical protein